MNRLRVSGGRRPGRRHVQSGLPCQDAYAILDQPELGRAAAAVADGLGSEPLSGTGSQVAADAAVAWLAQQETWDDASLPRAFEMAREALVAKAGELGVPLNALATTLQVATLDGRRVRAAMVGDGAIVLANPTASEDEAIAGTSSAAATTTTVPSVPVTVLQDDVAHASLLLAPPQAEYTNEVVPLTAMAWRRHLREATGEGDGVLLFSDGLTRLLLAKGKEGWSPFHPFFEAFLPHLRAASFDERLVEGFLARPDVDRSWDDDKCLVVLAHGPR